MKSSAKTLGLTYAEKCKNILVSNWLAQLNTIKADAKGSKEDIYSSKVKYYFKRGKPYVWVPENETHNLNTIIDERASLAVSSPFPGSLAGILRSMKRFPTRVALTGDLVPLNEEKVRSISESIKESILSEQRAMSQASYSVSGILTSSGASCKSRSESLQELLGVSDPYVMYKFDIRSCTYIDGSGVDHDLEMENIAAAKADLLSPYSAKLIDGINQSEYRRRALMLFCFVYMNVIARDALLLFLDRKGIDILAKVPSRTTKDGFGEYQWREYRFAFKEEARNIEIFCRLLVEMEEEALKTVSSYSGLGL